MQLSLVIENVSCSFGDVLALDNMNLKIDAGSFVSLLGPSGCGKTTTLRVVAGFEQPDAGTVRLGEGDLLSLPPNKRNLGMMFQDYALFPHMTVGENVAFGLRMAGVDQQTRTKRTRDALELVHLPNVEDRLPNQLSGGQKQRVALARSIVTNPAVLLLDEPLSALDKNLRESMQFELKRIQSSLGITTLMVTHDQAEALTLSDEIAVMYEGKVMQSGSPAYIYNSPTSRFVSEFLGAANILSGKKVGDNKIMIGQPGSKTILIKSPLIIDAATSVSFGVRPEKMKLSREAQNFDNKFLCEVTGYVFRGSTHCYRLSHPSLPTELLVYHQTTSRNHGQEFSIGEAIYVGWNIENSFVLSE